MPRRAHQSPSAQRTEVFGDKDLRWRRHMSNGLSSESPIEPSGGSPLAEKPALSRGGIAHEMRHKRRATIHEHVGPTVVIHGQDFYYKPSSRPLNPRITLHVNLVPILIPIPYLTSILRNFRTTGFHLLSESPSRSPPTAPQIPYSRAHAT